MKNSSKRVDKGIYQRGLHSFQVKMMVNSLKLDKTFDTIQEARIFRDAHRMSQALDIHESALIESRIKKQSIKGVTVGDMLDKYLLEITPLKKGASAEEFRIGKAKRMSIARKPLHGVTPDDVLAYLDEIGGSENNKRKYASIISHLYRVAIRQWRMPVSNPVTGQIDLPSNGKPRERRLKKSEYTALLKCLRGEARAFVIVAIETAMRRSEIFGLKWEHINKHAGTGLLKDTKNGETRTTIFSDVALEALESLGLKTEGEVWSITESQLRRQWEEARADIGADDLHFHDLRHEGTSRLFEKGLNVFEVQSITGHKTLSELRKYTHLTPSTVRAKLNKKP
ncbi:MAG: site-specific integrase [Zetaproteobacteria bacterium CG_4_10_14_3_um_filter_54_28]|nr:MAG: site-specific integrase [Zetaproteobacteria bacterium CG_4_10_14_3_um_filter_54_28]